MIYLLYIKEQTLSFSVIYALNLNDYHSEVGSLSDHLPRQWNYYFSNFFVFKLFIMKMRVREKTSHQAGS